MIMRTTRINNLNEKPSLILWGRVRFKSYVFVLKFCSFPNCLDVRKNRKLSYAA